MDTNLSRKTNDNNPLGISGLGGWLILIQIGIYLTIVTLIIQLIMYTIPSFNQESWNLLTSIDSEFYHPFWKTIIISEAIWNSLFLLYSVLVLIYLYLKKSIFPILMIIFYSSSLFMLVVDLIALNQIPLVKELEDGSSIRDIFKSIMTCVIWIPYFIKSERVKNTFIR